MSALTLTCLTHESVLHAVERCNVLWPAVQHAEAWLDWRTLMLCPLAVRAPPSDLGLLGSQLVGA